ncbi:MAG: RNase adapter RapZ [Cardiobacteriaceae bacterium]|nr:RNase adapter RapZ [Cardiobacteriaceae bacterium]
MLIITGLAGAGKTIALDTLEDLGYYCIDNLPSALLNSLVHDFAHKQPQPVAVAMDSRNAADLATLPEKIRKLRQEADIQVLFLTADTDALVRRYSETRRPHPLHIQTEQTRFLPEAIEYERQLLNSLMNLADIILDTSSYSVYQFKDKLRTILGDIEPSLIITLQSFGFKNGTPINADFLFDVRFLPNPYWEPEIRAYNGNDRPIIEFFERFDSPYQFINDTANYLRRWLPTFIYESHRAYLTIGIGCTGGQHRSVYVTEQIGRILKPDFPNLYIEHRDCKEHI